jgi:hypothetical protein
LPVYHVMARGNHRQEIFAIHARVLAQSPFQKISRRYFFEKCPMSYLWTLDSRPYPRLGHNPTTARAPNNRGHRESQRSQACRQGKQLAG